MVHVCIAIFVPFFLGQLLQGAKNPGRSSTRAAGHRQSLSRSGERVGDVSLCDLNLQSEIRNVDLHLVDTKFSP